MSERLSRMDRHPSTRKKRRKRPTFKQEWQSNHMKLTDTTVMRLSDLDDRAALAESIEPPPSVEPAAQAAPTRAERIKNAGAAPAPAAPSQEAEEDPDAELPPRSVMYPSSRIRLTKWFYETLLLLFLILLGTLLWWGTQMTGVKLPWQ
ncbi:MULTISPECIES: hypothetical protein [Saccharibacillus]|uniref:hypothetical protein n=1 Tax=Saccharibacillus TaxID=456492 RepID=UPI00123842EA|nr:hypothetical protein [Saccharibacillus sp. WB 17]MWJ33423.1 hypothetical protein [Saccharibacillus sp. WB 17]